MRLPVPPFVRRAARALAWVWISTHFAAALLTQAAAAEAPTPAPISTSTSASRETIVRAILSSSAAEKRELITSLAGRGDESIGRILMAWRSDQLFLHEAPDGTKIPVQLVGDKNAEGAQAALRVDTGTPLLDARGDPLWLDVSALAPVKHNQPLRNAMKVVLDIVDLASADENRRYNAVVNFRNNQDAEKLPALRERLKIEQSGRVRETIREAIVFIQLKDPSDDVKIAALHELADMETLASQPLLERMIADAQAASNEPVLAAARRALRAVESHKVVVNFFGTIFRGISTGSILLVVALGLAITFGLMGVINMAHGEMIAVGAYTTYVVQEIFGGGVWLPFFGLNLHIPGFEFSGGTYQSYFLVSLPLSFLMAALVGVALERTVIRFLYRRPLESLLATWGVSLIMQQGFKLMFGANNVNVQKPSYMSASWQLNDVGLGWAWLFIIGFAIITVVGLRLVLTRTPLGLLMRAVMQNRNMAACMGVRSTRVNLLTFALGCGLAGLAGAFVSQVTNVGPSLGQSYIIDSFLVVVVGGVGHLGGTVVSAYGIGGIDQVFQQYLPGIAPGLAGVPYFGNFLQNLGQDSAVFGKILVLFLIILFLQWRPAGIFVTRSRSLEG